MLAEIVAIVIATLIAVVARSCCAPGRSATATSSTRQGWRARVLEGTVLLAPLFFAMVVVLIVRGVLGTMSMHTAVVDTALQLVTALVLVRFGLYLLRLSLGSETLAAQLGNAPHVHHLAAGRVPAARLVQLRRARSTAST